ncbi:hypothetical protein GGF50DRAFT_116918 [Schizophyllum commune]
MSDHPSSTVNAPRFASSEQLRSMALAAPRHRGGRETFWRALHSRTLADVVAGESSMLLCAQLEFILPVPPSESVVRSGSPSVSLGLQGPVNADYDQNDDSDTSDEGKPTGNFPNLQALEIGADLPAPSYAVADAAEGLHGRGHRELAVHSQLAYPLSLPKATLTISPDICILYVQEGPLTLLRPPQVKGRRSVGQVHPPIRRRVLLMEEVGEARSAHRSNPISARLASAAARLVRQVSAYFYVVPNAPGVVTRATAGAYWQKLFLNPEDVPAFDPHTGELKGDSENAAKAAALAAEYAGERVFRVATPESDEALAEMQEELDELAGCWDGLEE